MVACRLNAARQSSVRQSRTPIMDMWKFYDITHRQHEICNPTSHEKLDLLVELLRLPKGAQVVDIGCGKAELLIRLAEE